MSSVIYNYFADTNDKLTCFTICDTSIDVIVSKASGHKAEFSEMYNASLNDDNHKRATYPTKDLLWIILRL